VGSYQKAQEVAVAVQLVGYLSAFSALISKNFHGTAIDCCVAGIFFEFISLQRCFVGSYKKALEVGCRCIAVSRLPISNLCPFLQELSRHCD
jgi:hypothetical protein